MDLDIGLRSEEFQEILGDIPSWILRWGITTIASVIGILLIGSTVFKYPDVISSSMTLTGTIPAASIVAKTSGKLRTLSVKDGQFISQGQMLAVIDNPARTEDVETLKNYLSKIFSMDNPTELPPKELTLGDMQNLYSTFCLTLTEYIQFLQLNYYPQKIAFTRERIRRNEDSYKNYLRQKALIEEQACLIYKQYVRDSSLYCQGVLSVEDLEYSLSEYLQSRLSVETSHANLINIQTTLVQLKESLLDTENQYADSRRTLETQLNNLTAQLSTSIQSWELNYVLTAPIDGHVSFANYWAENQNVSSQQEIFAIVPIEQGEIIGKAILPIARSGKVKIGQKVNIRFQNFPENEFGIVQGIVGNISQVPVETVSSLTGTREPSYVVSIRFPNGLKTNYNKTLPFMPQMQAQADIITEDLSLLERLFLPLKKIWKEGMVSSK